MKCYQNMGNEGKAELMVDDERDNNYFYLNLPRQVTIEFSDFDFIVSIILSRST